MFLSSQPIGQKALTRELVLLLGSAKPGQDRVGKSAASLDGRFLVPGRSGGRDGGKERGWESGPA